MKKLLLTTALVGVAFVATPAMAEVELGLGGHFKGYMTWNDQDEPDTAAASDETRNFDIVRDTEIHFTGETTLDNGLTVGFHSEAEADGGEFTTQESYAYFAGNWGRVNFGAEDGAAYLLQVAAPAADSNVDGIRQYVNPINYTQLDADMGGELPANFGQLDYAQDVSGYADKLTYISPVFNGFQGGLSFAPQDNYANDLVDGVRTSDDEDDLENIWEAAVRYEGVFNAVRLALGAGYSHASIEVDLAAAPDSDDQKAWNVGANVGFGPFNVGAVYVTDNNATSGSFDSDTWVLGVDYTTGPFVIGASYLDRTDDNQSATGNDIDTQRLSGGVTYTYGPGMSFRGSVHHVEHDANTVGVSDGDATSVLLGTQINF